MHRRNYAKRTGKMTIRKEEFRYKLAKTAYKQHQLDTKQKK